MYILDLRWRGLILATVVCLTCTRFVAAFDEPTLTKEQIKQFLVTAKVVKGERAKKGITDTQRLTLSDGTITHDASFQTIDEHKPFLEPSDVPGAGVRPVGLRQRPQPDQRVDWRGLEDLAD